MKLSKQTINTDHPRGVTLIELLVVVAILSVLTAIMIPRLRVINKDRNIREAARVVGSTLAKASSRAVDEGTAGIIIERNENFVDSSGVRFLANRMYAMRRLPPFSGDDAESLALVTSANPFQVRIRRPLEHTTTNPLVEVGARIRLNHSSLQYEITDVDDSSSPGGIILTLSLGLNGLPVRPVLQQGASVPYVITRLPRRLESSQVDLPSGYVIDLRFSGPLGASGSVFNQGTAADESVQLFFAEDGSIDRFAYTVNGAPVSGIPTDAFYFFVSEYDPEEAPFPLSLSNPAAMWVTADRASGSVNVGYNAPPPAGLTARQAIQHARGLSVDRRSASD